MKHLKQLLVLVGSLFLSAVALAQEVADGADTFATVYLVIGGLVLTGIGMLIAWGVSKLKGAAWKEVLGKFLNVFHTGLTGFHAKFKQELELARTPESPGGTVITNEEWDSIRTAMWQYLLDTYGSVDKVIKLIAQLTGGVATETAAKAFVNAKVDAGIAELERLDPPSARAA